MAGRKKIALCLEYPLALRGGVSVLVENLLEGLKEHYDLVLVSTDSPEEFAAHPASKYVKLHLRWNPRLTSPKTSKQLAADLKAHGVELAHFHMGGNFGWGNRLPGYCPIPYLAHRRVATVSTVHLVVHPLDGYCGPQKPLWFKLALFPLAWLGKMAVLAHVGREIAVSQNDAAKLRKWYWPLGKKVSHLYHSRLQPRKQPVTAPKRELFILNVGHVAWRKGQGVLAEAFAQIAARHPEWKLYLLGDYTEPELVEKIRGIAKAKGLEERLLVPGHRQDTLDWMQRAGIYVQPSFFEGLPLGLQEAQYMGCAAIGTRVSGIPELVEHEKTGLLVEPGQPEAMAAALERLITHPELREQYGRQAAASITEKGMTADQMAAKHVQMYESLLNRK